MKKSTFLIVGRHAVTEALKNPKRKVHRLFITEDALKKLNRENQNTNLIKKVHVFYKSKKEIDNLCGKEDISHQNIVAEIENFDATYRLNPVPSQTDTSGATVETNSWQKGIYTEQSAGILNKEQALLLAEIRYQLYKEQKQLEQELAIESINLLQVLGKNVGNLTTIHGDMVKAVKSWMIGGGGDSQPSGASGGS